MKHEYIKDGSRIPIQGGELRIDGRNDAGLFYCTEFIVTEDGDLLEAGKRHLTRQELQRLAHDLDGKNHSFMYVTPEG